MKNFEELLASSARTHGHLCPGQVVGVRMAMLGCRLIGLGNPTEHSQIKKLLVYVEMDRCAADAIAHVVGVKLGRRSLKFVDYGIMAATFVNLETGESLQNHFPQRRPAISPLITLLTSGEKPASSSKPTANAGQRSISRSTSSSSRQRLGSARPNPLQVDLLPVRAGRARPA